MCSRMGTGVQDGNTPLLLAAFKGEAETVRVLLEAGADKDKANKVKPA